MKLSNLACDMRPRNHWEAIDLGLRMLQQWFGMLAVTWFTFFLPVVLLCALVTWWSPGWGIFLLWWLKPLYDQPLLFVFSRRLFGETPTQKEINQARWAGWRAEGIRAITLRRFDPARTFNQPVSRLEGLTADQRSARLHILGNGKEASAANWLTITCLHFEMAIYGLIILAIHLLLPEQSDAKLWEMFTTDDFSHMYNYANLAAYALAISIIEPLYVAGGFALYLNRRSWLEAWDIELGFRRLASRLTKNHTNTAQKLLVAMACCLFVSSWGISTPSYADTTANPSTETITNNAKPLKTRYCKNLEKTQTRLNEGNNPVEQAMGKLMQEDGYTHCVTNEYWLPKDIENKFDKAEQDKSTDFGDWSDMAQNIASFGEFILWAAAVALLGLIIYWALVWSSVLQPTHKKQAKKAIAPAKRLFGLDVTPESLPEDITQTVLTLIQHGELREALSLLYRASLSRLGHDYHLDLSNSATEGECLTAVKQQCNQLELLNYFQKLTLAWQYAAYANRTISADSVTDLAAQWESQFSRGTAAAEVPNAT